MFTKFKDTVSLNYWIIINRNHQLRAHNVPGILFAFSYLTFKLPCKRKRYYYFPHFTDEKPEAQRYPEIPFLRRQSLNPGLLMFKSTFLVITVCCQTKFVLLLRAAILFLLSSFLTFWFSFPFIIVFLFFIFLEQFFSGNMRLLPHSFLPLPFKVESCFRSDLPQLVLINVPTLRLSLNKWLNITEQIQFLK